MIGELLPAAAVAVETRTERHDVELFPQEEAALGNAVPKRRDEFVTARACARDAFAQLGLPAAPIVSGADGEPLWPAGVVGSITHCAGYRACVLARRTELLTVGVDAEPNEPLPGGLLPDVALPQERGRLAGLAVALPEVNWDRLLFSAKESVYKAWFPLAGRWLGFEDATVSIDPARGTFHARLLVPGPDVDGAPLGGFSGRWAARDGLLLTAIATTSSSTPSNPATTEES
jgi:4'-phosphopantetheinyl transferase EntD